MKTTLLLLGLTLCAHAVTLTWHANPEPDIARYNLYWGGASGHYTNCITTTQTNLSMVLPTGVYYFVVTAQNTSNLESDPSNEVCWTNAPTPRYVTNLFQHSMFINSNWLTLTSWVVQVQPTGFYRVRLDYEGVPPNTNAMPADTNARPRLFPVISMPPPLPR